MLLPPGRMTAFGAKPHDRTLVRNLRTEALVALLAPTLPTLIPLLVHRCPPVVQDGRRCIPSVLGPSR